MTELEPIELDANTADRVVNQLRTGIPPTGYVRQFTIGRQEELRRLEHDLADGMHGRAVLVRANYGGGKTHLLNLVRDLALVHRYAVALVEVDASKGIRFNRADQVFSAVARSVELPDRPGKGLGVLFDAYTGADLDSLDEEVREERAELEDDGRWRQPGHVLTGPVYTALRAVAVSENDDVRDLALGWLTNVNPDGVGKTRIYEELVQELYVGDPRTRGQVLRDIQFRRDGQQPSWDALNGLDTLTRLSGYRGLVLLFDELENVLGLNHKTYEAAALENLFRFFAGDFLGGAYFAVTPDFTHKCTEQLLRKGVYDFPYKRFKELPHFELSPLEFDDFLKLTTQILLAHSHAFEWTPEEDMDWEALRVFLQKSWQPRNPSRIRLACQSMVEFLDSELDRAG